MKYVLLGIADAKKNRKVLKRKTFAEKKKSQLQRTETMNLTNVTFKCVCQPLISIDAWRSQNHRIPGGKDTDTHTNRYQKKKYKIFRNLAILFKNHHSTGTQFNKMQSSGFQVKNLQ